MITRRRVVLALGSGALMPLVSYAQQPPTKVYRIGVLGAETASVQTDRIDAVRAGLSDFGYVEDKNFVFEFRWAEGNYDRLRALATELVRLKVDVLVTFGQKAVDAAKQVTTTIPIVIPISSDAVATGLVTSLSHPGGNITGSSFFGPELMAKRLQLLKEAAPRIARVAVLLNPALSASPLILRAMKAAAKSLKLSLQALEVRAPKEFDSVFATMAKSRIDALVIHTDTLFASNHKTIADLAKSARLPSAGGYKEFAEAGGLISYGPNLLETYRRTAYFIDRIIKGSKPGDIPVEQSSKFETVVNLKTAQALGIKIPDAVLLRADKVIE